MLDYLTKIAQSSDHLLSLINDILDMSRIESGKVTIDEKEEELSDILHSIRNIFLADIKAKNLDLFIDTMNIKNEHIICDKLRLNQVLLNILSNAVKSPERTFTMYTKKSTAEPAAKPSTEKTLPFFEKYMLTIEEACVYFHIGEK